MAVLLLVFLLFAMQSGFAASNSKQVAQELKQVNKSLKVKEDTFQQQTRAIQSFDEQIAGIAKSYAGLEEEDQSLEIKIKELNIKKAQIEADLGKATQLSAQLARLYFMASDQNYFKILLKMGKPEQAARNPVYFAYLQKAYEDAHKTLEQHRLILQNNQQSLLSHKKELQALITKKQNKAQELNNKRDQRKKFLAKLSEEISNAKTRKNQLLKDQERLQKLAIQIRQSQLASRSASGIAFAKTKKDLLWPVDGKIIGQYGKKRRASGIRWHGLLIEAQSSTPVRAVAAGKVVFSNWMPGYGFMLIIEHSGDYLSLYGHNQRLLKSVGDSVKRGEQIAEVGNSGRSGNPALYFELRHKGEPVNPVKWLMAKANVH